MMAFLFVLQVPRILNLILVSKTHYAYTVLWNYVLPSLQRYSSRTLLKLYNRTPEGASWTGITYADFKADIERVALYWLNPLQQAGVSQRDVVGVWITGTLYTDLVNMYAMARIGFIPQMLNKAMATQGSDVVKDMLTATDGKVVLFDPFFRPHVAGISLPCLELVDLHAIPQDSYAMSTLPDLPLVDDKDVAVIFHTSGTTSGKPKPVPETHRWLRCQAQVQWPAIWQGGDGQAVVNNLGSFANVGSATTMSYLGWSGHCLLQTSRPDIDAEEFLAMVDNGLNFVMLYAPWLSKLIDVAKVDIKVLKALQSMRQVTYTGAALNPEDEEWLIGHDIKATVIYATTEAGGCLVSDISDLKTLPSMHIIEGIKCRLIPTSSVDKSGLDGDSERRVQGGQLYDCFIPADADNCPHPSIRNRPDGHITGDLFEETAPGYYAFRGRNDDWIRTGKTHSFCDTKSIEDNVLQTCADLVQNCVVVGHYKPGIVLLVEPSLGDPDNDEAMSRLKKLILERHGPFNARLFEHERINHMYQIVTVPRKSLPRTMEKGNIRRKATEEEHKEKLEEIYARLKVW